MKLIPIIADTWKLDGGVAFGVVPRVIWEGVYPSDEHNRVPIVSRCLLVDTGSRRILFEAGMGRKQPVRYYEVRGVDAGGGVAAGLAEHGYSPEDITDVVFTHLHDDHVGGAVIRNPEGSLELLFAGARHYCSASQWKWAMQPNSREAASYFPENLLPLKDSIILLEGKEALFEGIRFEIFNGHTMGQLVPHIFDGERTWVYAADFIPSHAHIHVPFVTSMDIQPLVAMEEKQHFLDIAIERKYMLIYEHDSMMEASELISTEKGFRAGHEVRLNSK